MTSEERQQAFAAAYNALVQQYGVVLEAQLQAEQLGTAILTKPVIVVALVNGWLPAPGPKESVGNPVSELPVTPSPNGHKEAM
jgi:hypothetical protein